MSGASWAYRLFGIGFGVVAIVVAFKASPSKVEYAPVAGIAVFAVLYVIAQAVERVVEWVTDLLRLIDGTPNNTRPKDLRAIRLTVANVPGANATAETAKDADDSRTDIVFLTHGLAILLSVILVTKLNYGIMDSLGATGVDGDVDRFLTALAAAGGSKGLHELIGRVQAAKESAQTTGR